MNNITLFNGDCREVLKGLEDSSVDAVVCDPPYELGFMGKKWDASGIAYDVGLWGEVLRVLKPGGHVLAFGGARTYHRMAVAIEDAGFEIRDSIHWLYGSGFPKSLDVSKAIDKAAGAEREVVGKHLSPAGSKGNTFPLGQECDITAPATDAARQWEGWGTALKPAHEPIVVARKPLVGTVAANVLEHGTGALNIDGCRVGTNAGWSYPNGPRGGGQIYGNGNGIPPMLEPHAATAGRWPANLVLTHAAECDEACAEGCPVAELDGQSGVSKSPPVGSVCKSSTSRDGNILGKATPTVRPNGHGDTGGASRFFTVTEWDPIADVAPFRYVAKPSKRERNAGLDGLEEKVASDVGAKRGRCGSCARWADSGEGANCRQCGAAFEWTSNASKPQSNHHPTVKPVELMRWLVRLVTPPGGVVLDPFAGSGTTLVAAVLEDREAVGIELTEEYIPIIKGRVAWAKTQLPEQPKLDLGEAS